MNKNLIEQFLILKSYNELIKKDKNRAIGYTKIIKKLSTINKTITDIKDLDNIKGIGPKTKKKVKEYLTTGKIEEVINTKLELGKLKYKNLPRTLRVKKVIKRKNPTIKDAIINDFLSLYGVGEVTANNLWEKGMRSVNDVSLNLHLLSDISRKVFPYKEDLKKSLSREFVFKYTTAIRAILSVKFGKKSFKMVVAGSYRRKRPSSGDIDILLLSDTIKLSEIVEFLNKKGMIAVNLTKKGNYKFMAIAKWPVECGDHPFRLDILLVPRDEWVTSISYFTGSYEYNFAMRQRALDMGYSTLNEHHLKRRDGTDVRLEKEEELWEILGLDFVKPEDRDPI